MKNANSATRLRCSFPSNYVASRRFLPLTGPQRPPVTQKLIGRRRSVRLGVVRKHAHVLIGGGPSVSPRAHTTTRNAPAHTYPACAVTMDPSAHPAGSAGRSSAILWPQQTNSAHLCARRRCSAGGRLRSRGRPCRPCLPSRQWSIQRVAPQLSLKLGAPAVGGGPHARILLFVVAVVVDTDDDDDIG